MCLSPLDVLSKGAIRGVAGGALLIVASAIFASCLAMGSLPRLEEQAASTINSPESYRLLNLTVVHVEPGGEPVRVQRRGYNVRTGNSFRVPFEEIKVVAGSETYLVSTNEAGRGLLVNGESVIFDTREQHLRIAVGSGYSIEPGGTFSFKEGDFTSTYESSTQSAR